MYRTGVTEMDCAVLQRSSTRVQGTSIGNQGRTIESIIAEKKLNIVKEYVLEGVTGSIPANRTDIDEVIELKQKLGLKKLLLLVPDHTRFTRAGAGHGGHLLYLLRANGILVYFVAEDILVENDLTLQLAIMLLAAAHQTAKSIARSATIGSDTSYLKGKSPHSRVAPFGLDRMYSVDGKPIHIIRNLTDGTQEMLDPETLTVIRRFGQNPKKGVPAHYIKSKNEVVELCVGAPEAVAVLFLLFEMKYVRLLPYREIALQLNDAGINSPRSAGWSGNSVRKVLLNPIYIGLSVRYQTTTGVYVQGGSQTGEPEPSEVTPEELDQNPNVKVRRKKREKWREREAPQFKDFLPADARESARQATLNHLDLIADRKPLTVFNRDPHVDSLYFLNNILHCKKTGILMTDVFAGTRTIESESTALARVTTSQDRVSRRKKCEPNPSKLPYSN